MYLFLFKEEILGWMKQGHVPLVLIYLLTAAFALVPIIPFSLVIGTIAFIYGPVIGSLISWLGAWTSALLLFMLVRYSFQQKGRQWLAKSEKIERFTEMMERSPFLAILFARLLPLVPQTLVNAYSALLSVSFVVYAAASAVGKLPGMLVYALIGSRIANLHDILLIAAGYAAFLLVVYGVYKFLYRSC